MTNKLDTVLQTAPRPIQLMTHVVAGYPDWETCSALVQTMARSGVRLLEVQLPFTDPLADGPTITAANQAALDAGVRPEDALKWMGEMAAALPEVAFLVMTYANIPYAMGLSRFVDACCRAGAQGIILPDLPLDEPEGTYAEEARRQGLHPILVISPDTPAARLDFLLPQASGMIYTTLKVGITGASKDLAPASLAYLETLRRRTQLPVAAGFGISQPEHVAALRGRAEVAVVGSHILGLVTRGDISAVEDFLRACTSL